MTQMIKQSQVHQELLDQFTIADIDELQKVFSQVTSSKLKLLIERDLAVARSKLVTRLVNQAHSKVKAKENTSSEINIEFVDEEIEIEEEDIDGYIRDNIKGFDNKLKSIKSILTDTHESKIKEALICCGGNEEKTIEALVSLSLPPRPQIPKRKVKKIVKKKVKKQKGKDDTTSVVQSDETEDDKYLRDITLPQHTQNLQKELNERNRILKDEIEIEKKKTKRYIDEINKHKSSTGNLSNLQSLVDSTNDDEMKTNRLFLAGEYEAIENLEFRLFTFKPERTFANEVSHIHFRVAESEFHRMLVLKSSHRVTEVKYIVSPPLINRFERRRAEMAFAKSMKFKDLKPILAFSVLKNFDDDSIMNIAREGFLKGPVSFTYNPNNANSYITASKKVMFFLVLAPNQIDKFTDFTVTDVELILPYYIVHYDSATAYQYNAVNPTQNQLTGLHQEWENIEKEAKADKFMDDVKKFYQQTLVQKDKEVKMGAIDGTQLKSGTDLWFDKVYSKKAEKEAFVLGADDIPSALSNASFEFEEVDDEHEHDQEDDVDDDDDIDLENLTEEERRLLMEADDDDEEMHESQN